MAHNKHDNLGEKPRVRHRACSVTLIIVIKEIKFQNKCCVFVDLAWDIIRTWGFAGLEFAESVVKVLHGKRGVNRIQCGLRGWDWNRGILGREPNLVGECNPQRL